MSSNQLVQVNENITSGGLAKISKQELKLNYSTVICVLCKGVGYMQLLNYTCKVCQGVGKINIKTPYVQCATCKGQASINGMMCPICKATGHVPAQNLVTYD